MPTETLVTKTTNNLDQRHTRLAGFANNHRRKSMTVAEGAKSRFSSIMLRRSSQSSNHSSSSSSNGGGELPEPKKSVSRRQSLTRMTASSLAKVVPSLNKGSNNQEGSPSSFMVRRRNSVMSFSSQNNTTPHKQPPSITPHPSGSLVVKSSTSSSNMGGHKWPNFTRLRRPSSPTPTPLKQQQQQHARRASMQKDPSKLATLASTQQPSPPQPQQLIHPYHQQQQQRPASPPSPTPPSTQQRATLLPRSVSNTQRPIKDESGGNNNNAPVRRRSSVQIDNDSNISNNSSIRRRSSMMLDSDISAESRRSNASSCHRHHRSQQQNEPYQPVWLRRQTQCAACNPNPVRKSLSRSSSMYDVAGVAQQQHPRAIHTGAQQHPNTHATLTTTATSSSSSQNNTTPPTAAATAAAAMAAAAAVVSAAAATAACGISTATTTTTSALDEQWGLTQQPNDDKWMRLISSCMTQSGRLERLARDMVATEKQAASMIDSQQSMEQLMKRRDDQHHTNIRHCESLVRAQREMLNEMEDLLTEYGIKRSNQQQKQSSPQSPTTDQHEQQRQAMTTPPPSSPSDYSSSLSSMPPSPSSSNHNNENEENEQENVTSSEVVNDKEQEQASSSSTQDDKEQETTVDSIQEQQDDQSNSDKEQQKTLGDFVEDSVSRIRWTVSQWVGGSVGTGQLVKCEMGPDGQTSTIIVAGTGVTTEPKLLPKHLICQDMESKPVYYHQYILYIEREDRANRFCLLPPSHWVADAQAHHCQFTYTDESGQIKCQSEFDWAIRRHHCRRCGHIFCNSHSSNRLPLFDTVNGKAEWSRVCDTCFYDLAGASLFHPTEQQQQLEQP
ncbi:hypothetical protein K492DRAFT_178165 [Lichtheimia hyalospora FSU 10163]|nr:hypothetical protein K492DRAFT_178165 [Lichtheimia hyalospora FSU 10163]